MSRQFNLLARGEREPLRDYLRRFKEKIASKVVLDNHIALASPDYLFAVDTGQMEIRGDSAVFLALDGVSIVATIPLDAKEDGGPWQNFGLGPKAVLRIDLDPMDEERARRILKDRTPLPLLLGQGSVHVPVGVYTTDELEAIVYLARHPVAPARS